jgi:hypothetical protein
MPRYSSILLAGAVALTVGCGGDTATGMGAPPACSSALAAPIALSVGSDTALDPVADSGCVTFALDASAGDSAEYLVVARGRFRPGRAAGVRLPGASTDSSTSGSGPAPA